MYSDNNSQNLIGRISINIEDNNTNNINGIQDQTDIISIIKNINEDIINNVVIKGIPNIENIIFSDIDSYTVNGDKIISSDKENYNITSKSKTRLISDGINLIQVMNNNFVNSNETFSNSITEIYDVLGIEAARNILIHEINDVVDHAGEYINLRHIELLCDVMTSKGEITSINRQGINRGDVGPLAKCSFEDTTDQLIKAGIFAEKDKLTGVSSNIMMGQCIKAGTGLCNIMLDEDKLLSSLKDKLKGEEEFIENQENDINKLLEEDDDDICTTKDFKFSFE
jgi:DNA-directed RNA polymerase II subunit RPB1